MPTYAAKGCANSAGLARALFHLVAEAIIDQQTTNFCIFARR